MGPLEDKLMAEMVASPMPEVCNQWLPCVWVLDKALNCCDKCSVRMVINVMTWVSDDAADYDELATSLNKLQSLSPNLVVSDERRNIIDNDFCVPTRLPSLEETTSHVNKLLRSAFIKAANDQWKANKAAFRPRGKAKRRRALRRAKAM